MIDEKIQKLIEIIKNSKSIVFFGGAGVSVESNIPDFRSSNGLYNDKSYSKYSPEEILSHSFFFNHTEMFYDFYKNKMIYKDALPNDAHIALAKLEEMGKVKAVVTQNIDNLHTLAGSKVVYELHGSVYRNTCLDCGKKYGLDAILNAKGVPHCSCGGIIKPDVVLYEEGLDMETIKGAVRSIASCDTLIIGGTSLAVYPAAGLIQYFQGNNLVIINKSITQYDKEANLVISDSIGKVFKLVMENING